MTTATRSFSGKAQTTVVFVVVLAIVASTAGMLLAAVHEFVNR